MKELNRLQIISVLLILVLLTALAAISLTFAGNPTPPDTTVTYTRNKLTWDVETVNGVAQLRIFDRLDKDGDVPLINPLSKDTFNFRIHNDVGGTINYYVYLYTDLDNKVPIKFDLSDIHDIEETNLIPNELDDYKILSSFVGELNRGRIDDLPIKWYWDSESDLSDTLLGNKATNEDIFCNVYMQIVIEDNNVYYNPPSGSGGTTISVYRGLHKSYIAGYPNKTFGPENDITRAEVSAIFARILSNFEDSRIVYFNTGFNDIDGSQWYDRYVSKLEKENIISGYSDGSFKPTNEISRAEFTTMCVRYYEKCVGEIDIKKSDLVDLDKDYWATENILKANSIGLISGYPDKTFRPEQNITRSEVVTVINRLLNRKADKEYINSNLSSLNLWEDVKDKDYWAFYDIYEASFNHFYYVEDGLEDWQGVR